MCDFDKAHYLSDLKGHQPEITIHTPKLVNIYRVPAIHHAQCQALGIERGTDSTGLMELQASREENFWYHSDKVCDGCLGEGLGCQEWRSPPRKGTWIKV